MRHPLRRTAALLLALSAFLIGSGATPASAANLQGANRFENAPFIQTVGGVFHGTTDGATKQAGEPNHAGNAGGRSVWFKWRAVNDGLVRFTTSGSDFDTLLAVYRGSNLSHLAEVASNDDSPSAPMGEYWSRLQFQAQAGVTYRIAIDGYNDEGTDPPPAEHGHYVLRVTNFGQDV